MNSYQKSIFVYKGKRLITLPLPLLSREGFDGSFPNSVWERNSRKASACVKQSFTDKCVPKQSLGTSSEERVAAEGSLI